VVSRGAFYGVIVVFVALLLIISTFAIIYFNDYQQSSSQNTTYANELGRALASYNSLSSSYNSSLKDYNTTLTLLATAVANLNTSSAAYRNASVALSTLWKDYQRLAGAGGRKALVYSVRLLVDFGNGTRRWYNGTSVQPGWNGYVVSLVLLDGNIQGIWYPKYGEHLVTGVDGVAQTQSTSWFVWEFSGGKWSASQTGSDQMQINNGTAIAWTLCGYDANFVPTCSP
jgi:hypothetical protein